MIGRRAILAGLAGTAFTGTALAPAALRADEVPHIVMLGDSLTAGFGLPQRDGLVPVLQDWLARRGAPARLINHGLSGDTTYGGRVRVRWALRRGADAVMVELGANDMLLGWSPARAEANLDAILGLAGQGGRPVLLIGVDAKRGSKALQARWRAIWPRLAARHKALWLPDLYAPISALPREQRKEVVLADGIHPSANGVRLLAAHLGPAALQLVRLAQERRAQP